MVDLGSWNTYIVKFFWQLYHIGWIAFFIGTGQHIVGYLRARGYRELTVFAGTLAWTYYLLMLYLLLMQAVNPMVAQLERLANPTNGTDPAPRAPANLDFPARAQETRGEYWTNDIIYQNNTPATNDIYQNYTPANDRPLHDYL